MLLREARSDTLLDVGHASTGITLDIVARGVAQLRLLLVEPTARGLGIGGALVAAVVDFACAAGYTKITLWTQSVLAAAAAIYRRAGFEIAKAAEHHSFGADLVEQVWERTL